MSNPPSARNASSVMGAAAIINVPNVEASLDWYAEVLGLDIEFAWGDPVIHGSVRAGNTSFHFQQGEPTSPATSYMTLYVKELDALFDDIGRHSVEVINPPETMPWGMRAFMIKDLNGAQLMFADPSTGE